MEALTAEGFVVLGGLPPTGSADREYPFSEGPPSSRGPWLGEAP